MNKLKNTKKSAAFDRSSLIINLFREFQIGRAHV